MDKVKTIAIVSVIAAAAGGFGALSISNAGAESTTVGATTANANASANATPLQNPPASSSVMVRGLPDFADLVDLVGPSVVNIRILEKPHSRSAQNFGMDEDMQDFFRRFGIPIPNMPRQNPRQNRPQPDEEPQQRGVGSGFILSADGLVMTNAHVVEGADEVIVTLTDKREFKAKIIGTDKRSDVAVVKIEAAGLPVVRIGDANRLRVGEWVMAIGSPFNLENSVTAGIVSAKQRDTGDYLPLIQTDVAINPGNSGGPLLNMRGEVVGINSQIYSRSGGYMGISFAIPIDEAMRVSEQLRNNGHVSRGRIGVQITPLTKELAESLGLSKPIGALVRMVEAGSPAEKAGVEAGDVIIKLDGKTIEKSSDLPRAVGSTKPGSKANLTVWRRGASKDLSITIAEMPDDKSAAKSTGKEGKDGKDEKSASQSGIAQTYGFNVRDVSAEQRKELKIRGGVRVNAVSEGAARAGLQEDDIIVGAANTEVTSVKDLESVLNRHDKSKNLLLLVRRGESVQYVLLKPARG
jgi:serine protease Do